MVTGPGHSFFCGPWLPLLTFRNSIDICRMLKIWLLTRLTALWVSLGYFTGEVQENGFGLDGRLWSAILSWKFNIWPLSISQKRYGGCYIPCPGLQGSGNHCKLAVIMNPNILTWSRNCQEDLRMPKKKTLMGLSVKLSCHPGCCQWTLVPWRH